MRNLKVHDGDSFEFHKKVIERKNVTKNNPQYKGRVSSFNDDVEKQHKEYDKHFENNSLELLSNFGYIDNEKDDLHNLYTYGNKVIQGLKLEVTTTETNRIINTCQNCTISEINSFDHVLPKNEFAEYIVNPKNLFPSCSICNGYKGVTWRSNGKKKFLNLYLDLLPQKQYLFVKITIKENSIETEFYLDNSCGIDDTLFELIKNHYSILKLFSRFSKNSDSVIIPFISSIQTNRSKLSVEDIVELTVETINRNKIAFGFNYWKSVLEMALINNEKFIEKYL